MGTSELEQYKAETEISFLEDGTVLAKITGTISEFIDFTPLLATDCNNVILDLGGVIRINSIGVKEWIQFITQFSTDRDVTLIRCPDAFVRNINSIINMTGAASIGSVLLPYYCSECHHEEKIELKLDEDMDSPPTIEEEIPCKNCQGSMQFDELIDSYVMLVEKNS